MHLTLFMGIRGRVEVLPMASGSLPDQLADLRNRLGVIQQRWTELRGYL
jgi:hypothetical protein